MAFKPYHMEELRKLGMGGYPCATYAANEIQQLNMYVYALESALVFGFSNREEVRQMIAALREGFAPDVDFPEVPNAPASAVSSGNESGDAQERIIEQQQSTIDALLARTEQLEQVIQADKDDCEQAFADIARLTAERDGIARDLHAEHALVVQLQSDVERLQAGKLD